jgi:hypothetical protein
LNKTVEMLAFAATVAKNITAVAIIITNFLMLDLLYPNARGVSLAHFPKLQHCTK